MERSAHGDTAQSPPRPRHVHLVGSESVLPWGGLATWCEARGLFSHPTLSLSDPIYVHDFNFHSHVADVQVITFSLKYLLKG